MDTEGVITTVAGNGLCDLHIPEGTRATAAPLCVMQIELDGSGELLVRDLVNIWRLSPDGTIELAVAIGNSRLGAFTVDRLGNIYYAYRDEFRGLITRIDTGGQRQDFTVGFDTLPRAFAVDTNNVVYFINGGANKFIYRMNFPARLLTPVAGSVDPEARIGNNMIATASTLHNPDSLVFDGAGNLYFSTGEDVIRQIPVASEKASGGEVLMASEDGTEVYAFTADGRHLATYESRTGAVLWQFGYDVAGRLASVEDAVGQVTTIERTGGALTGIVAPHGQRTAIAVNTEGYVESITNPAQEQVQLAYRPGTGLLTEMVDARGNPYAFSYDDDGRLELDANPAGGSWTLSAVEEDVLDDTITLKSAMDRTSTYRVDRDTEGRQTRTNTFPGGEVAQQQRGLEADIVTTAADGTVTVEKMGSDPRFGVQRPVLEKRVVTLPSGLEKTERWSHTATMASADVLDPAILRTVTTVNGRQSVSTYTAATREELTVSPAGRRVVTTYDALGRIAETRVGNLAAIRFTYDDLGRLKQVTHGEGAEQRVTDMSYDAQGRLETRTDALGRTVAFEYDDAGRVTRQTEPDLREVALSYDANGNLASLSPPGREAHEFRYTAVNLEQSYSPPDVGFSPRHTEYVYNVDQQLTETIRPDADRVVNTYSAAGRLDAVTHAHGSTAYTYEPSGQVSTASTPDVTLSYTYDGSLTTKTSWSGAVVGEVAWTYDNDFRVASRTVNGGNAISYGYDADGLLVQVGDLTMTRDSQNGLVTGTTLGGVSDVFGYNAFGEVTSYSASFNSAPLYAVTYERDALGRITVKNETVHGETHVYEYTYHPAGWLERVKTDGVTTGLYTYDANGNRLSHFNGTTTVTATYDGQDRLLTYGDYAYTYTENGERETKVNTVTSEVTTYLYDAVGNLLEVGLPDGTQVSYVVDGSGRRVAKKLNGALTQVFVYENQLRVAAELDGAGNVTALFVYTGSPNSPDYAVKGATTYRMVTNELGSPVLVVDTTTETVAQRIRYDEYGVVLSDTSPGFQPFGFAGGAEDIHTGITRFGARDYEADTGRWSSKDPLRFDGHDTNLFGYALNDPVNATDPLGLFACSPTPVGILLCCAVYPAACAAAAAAIAAGAAAAGDAMCGPEPSTPGGVPGVDCGGQYERDLQGCFADFKKDGDQGKYNDCVQKAGDRYKDCKKRYGK